MPSRETWATRIGFILAAVGSAVGLGNIWRFPFVTGENGGAAFVVVYLVFVVLVGLPVLLVEFVIGRRAARNPIGAFERLGHSEWTFAGALGALAGFVILSYYSVAAGWILQYLVASPTGAYFGDPGAYFDATASGSNALLAHAAFMTITASVVLSGVRGGIERAARLMVPIVVVLLVGLAAYGATLEGAGDAYAYYLSPDLGAIVADAGTVLPAAAGQAFFTLSLGMGVMITYASYLGEDRNLVSDALTVVVIDTAIAFLAGLVVLPFLFAQNVDPGEPGPGALFVSVAAAFAEMPSGEFIAVVFFFMVAVAALTSAFSILEVIVSYLMDNHDLDRRTATIGVAGTTFLLGVPSALDIAVLTAADAVANNVLLLLGGLLLSVFVGWVFASEAVDEFGRGTRESGATALAWLWAVRVPVLVVLAATLVLGFGEVVEAVRGVL